MFFIYFITLESINISSAFYCLLVLTLTISNNKRWVAKMTQTINMSLRSILALMWRYGEYSHSWPKMVTRMGVRLRINLYFQICFLWNNLLPFINFCISCENAWYRLVLRHVVFSQIKRLLFIQIQYKSRAS